MVSGTWVGYHEESKTYFEIWFNENEMIIYDIERGLYQASYHIQDSTLILDNSVFPIKSFSIKHLDSNEIILFSNKGSEYRVFKVEIPYFIDPFAIEVSLEDTSDKYDMFWEEAFSRRDFFIPYLKDDSI